MQSVIEREGTRSVLQTLKTIEYEYVEPVREVVTQLRLFPHAERGAQRLLRHECEVSPHPDQTRTFVDDFGNEVREYHHAVVAERLRFAVGLMIEHADAGDTDRRRARLIATHGVPAEGVGAFLAPSRLVDDCEEIHSAARRLEKRGAARAAHVEAIGGWVYEQMQFAVGVTDVETPASVALAGKGGVCQDYAHIMLAICRVCGIPARYVSGFIPGEGYMHAWVEALVSDSGSGTAHWIGYDPTHDRRPDRQYLAVAMGRDYADVSPVTGSFYGSAPGRLTSWAETVWQSPMV
jgi:transglutaminase-like putative cysteine protease